MNYKITKDTTLENNELDISDVVNNLILPQTSFSKGVGAVPVKVIYISDLHMPEHITNEGIDISNKFVVKKHVKKLADKLFGCYKNDIISEGVTPSDVRSLINEGYYSTFLKNHSDISEKDTNELLKKIRLGEYDYKIESNLKTCVCFIGDMSYDFNLVDLLFSLINVRIRYEIFKKWKADNIQKFLYSDDELERLYNLKKQDIKQKCDYYKFRIKEVEKKYNKKNLFSYYSKRDNSDIERLIKARNDLPDYVACLIIKAKKLVKLSSFMENTEQFTQTHKEPFILEFPYRKTRHCPFFYVLGNHELSQFYSIEEAIKVYRGILEKYNVTLLHNNSVIYGNCVILGGTGFAKYNERYNTNNVIGPGFMKCNRDAEKSESDKLFQAYRHALNDAIYRNIPLISITHYPIHDWLGERISQKCYYFYGHNHQNRIVADETGHIYADNQIGYTETNIGFKSATLGTCYNPFYDYEDGYYEITPKQYNDFYNYSGEFIRTKKISNYIEKGDKFYLIKRKSFYVFFLIGRNAKICCGGDIKTVGSITDIQHYYDVFSLMVMLYLKPMIPLRFIQEKISKDLKSLGISTIDVGRIHGTIIDVDFYHHIMINPIDGKITYYYSPFFGAAREFEGMDELLISVMSGTGKLPDNKVNMVINNYNSLPHDSLLKMKKDEVAKMVTKEVKRIDIKNSVYSLSRRINQLQRLFSANILRDWNESVLGKDLDLIAQNDVYSYKIKNLRSH